jgi:ATP-dependent RNA helicase DDX31/DBP7
LQNLQAELKEGEKLIDRGQGLRALILAPTRELCVQIEEVIRNLSMRFYWIVSGTVMGGEKKKSEKARLRKGVTILVATPGRLLDHLKTTEAFKVSNLSYLVFDESDRLMDLGFEKAVMEILDILKFKAAQQFESGTFQTIMLSATQTQSLEGFSRQLLKNPEYVSIANASKANAFALPETLQHGLIEVGYEKKFSALLGFLTWKIMSQKDLKAIIFMTACDQVEYFYNLFIAAEVFSEDVKLHMLHGSLPQVDRTQVFLKFCSAKSGILICTNVAARGLDLPEIDWSIQFDAPEDIPEYVHRAGRTARRGRKGRGLIFLSPSHEIEFANVLQDQQILLRKVEAEPLLKVGGSLMLKCFDALKSDPALEQKAHAAFVSFVRGYSTYPKHLKHIFHPNNLHLGHVARSFLLREAPSTIAKIFNHNHQPRAHSTQTSTKRPMNTKFNALSEFMM